MTDIMCDMYNTGLIDGENVTVNSAFICMLHLANEKSLKFDNLNLDESEFMVCQDWINYIYFIYNNYI